MFLGGPKHTGRSPYDTSHVDGTEKWSFQTGGIVFSSPAVGPDGTIYVGSDDDNLYAIGESPSTPPSAPLDPLVTVSDGQVELTWDARSENGGDSINQYKIYRGTSSDNLSLYDDVDGSTTSYTDTDLTNGQTYYYQVSAVNSVGEGDKSSKDWVTLSSKDEQNDDGGTPGFTTMILLLAMVTAVVIYKNKKR